MYPSNSSVFTAFLHSSPERTISFWRKRSVDGGKTTFENNPKKKRKMMEVLRKRREKKDKERKNTHDGN